MEKQNSIDILKFLEIVGRLKVIEYVQMWQYMLHVMFDLYFSILNEQAGC